MKKIVLWGASGQAVVLAEFLAAAGYELVALFDNNKNAVSPLNNIPLYYGKDQLTRWRKENTVNPCFFAIAIGGDLGRDRIELHEFLELQGMQPASLVHPTAFVASNARLGCGCQILAKSCVAAAAVLEDQVIVNSSANVDHECILSKGVHIGPGAVLAGCVSVDEYSFIGTGAVILPRIKIGKNAIIGAGSVITRDVPDNVVIYGNPGKVQRKNISTD